MVTICCIYNVLSQGLLYGGAKAMLEMTVAMGPAAFPYPILSPPDYIHSTVEYGGTKATQ